MELVRVQNTGGYEVGVGSGEDTMAQESGKL